MADFLGIKKNGTSYDVKDATARNGLSSKYDTSDTAETTLADDDKIPFYDTSATGKRHSTWSNIKSVLKTYFDQYYGGGSTVSIATTTVSGLTSQKITIDGSSTPIDGTKYLEATTYTSPDTSTRRFTFTNSAITSNGVYNFYCDVFNVFPKAVSISSTTMTVDFYASDSVTKCRVYIRG